MAWPSVGQYLAFWGEDRLAEHDWHAVEAIVSDALCSSSLEDFAILASLLARTYRGLEARARELAGAADERSDELPSYYGASALRYESLAVAAASRPQCSHPAVLERTQ